jgi:glyoxylase-like metal-dependent hydrolase (beta-lactamase superfamily II)
MSALPASPNLRFEELAPGVYAAIALEAGLAASNSGIVDLGERTLVPRPPDLGGWRVADRPHDCERGVHRVWVDGVLVFDTTYSPITAAELRAAAQTLTGRSPALVLNSHWHGDHVYGNAVFAGAEIYATARTREIMAEKTPAGIVEFKAHWPGVLSKIEADLDTAADEAQRADLLEGRAFVGQIVASLPQLESRLPDHTFTERVVFEGTRRTAEFVSFGGGHTESDAMLHLPQERLAFMGDLLVVNNHPWLGDGDPHQWLQSLDRVEALHPKVLVPGHGSVGALGEVALIRRYITALLGLASEVVRAGGSAEDAEKQPIPAPFEAWEGNREGFGRNLKFLHQYVSK